MRTRSGVETKYEDPKNKPVVVPRKKRVIEHHDTDDDEPVQLDGETVFERLETLLEKTSNFSIPITRADIKAVHGGRLTLKKQRRIELDMVAQGYDRTATYYEKTPDFINGEMRDYQIEGLNWMIALQKANLNGILADEMGLGKTLQSISLIAHNKLVEKSNLPSIVIAPLPTVINWGDEFERFCPRLKVLVLSGTMDERKIAFRKAIKAGNIDVYVMSYETAIYFTIVRSNFNYVIIDEAQRIKNDKTTLAVAVRRIRSNRRLLLTGTPFQNNVHELWALLSYLVPALFDDSESFDEYFSSQNMSDEVTLINRLHRILNPFMLRRVKQDVEKSLLPKKEYKILMGLTDLQKEWYAKVLKKEIAIMRQDGRVVSKRVANIIMHLREVANHPYMFPAAEPSGPPFVTDETIVTASGKMMVLDKMLDKFKAEGSRVLLFSQFTMMLDIIEDYAIWKDIKYSRFDGQTDNEERFDKVKEFNSDGSETFLFLMSTRAGGLGINLATADVVIIFDSDWNPQMDFQAIARAHRIGQKKQVRVFRLITEGTVDEYIIRTNEHKVRLGSVIIQDKQALMEETKTKKQLLEMLNEAEHCVSAGTLESIGEIDLDKMIKDAEDLAENQLSEKREKLAKDNKYLVHMKKNHEIWEFSGRNHWADSRREFEDLTLDSRLRKNPKMTESEDQAFTSSEFWMRCGMHFDHNKTVWNYRFYPQRYVELCIKKFAYMNGQNQIIYLEQSESVVPRDKKSEPLTAEESEELHKLGAERACSWSFTRFSVYVSNLMTVDRFNHERLARSITCDLEEVIKFSEVLWQRIDELPNKDEIRENIRSYERTREKDKQIHEMIQKKVCLFENPKTDMFFNYSLLHYPKFHHSEPEDRFMIMYQSENGYSQNLQAMMQEARYEPRSFNWPCLSAGLGVFRDRFVYLVNLVEEELKQPLFFLPSKFTLWTDKQVAVWFESFMSPDDFQLVKELSIDGMKLEKMTLTNDDFNLPERVYHQIKDELTPICETLHAEIASNIKGSEVVRQKMSLYQDPATQIEFNYSLLKWEEKVRTNPIEDKFIIMYSHQNGLDTTNMDPLMKAIKEQPRYYKWPCYRAGHNYLKKRLLFLISLIENELAAGDTVILP